MGSPLDNLQNLLPNLFAVVGSSVAIILLIALQGKVDKELRTVMRLLVLGIFFAVFAHAGFELAVALEFISEAPLMKIMGTLLSIGSVFFIIAGLIGLKPLE